MTFANRKILYYIPFLNVYILNDLRKIDFVILYFVNNNEFKFDMPNIVSVLFTVHMLSIS